MGGTGTIGERGGSAGLANGRKVGCRTGVQVDAVCVALIQGVQERARLVCPWTGLNPHLSEPRGAQVEDDRGEGRRK